MNFSEAIEQLKNGKRLSRKGWNGSDMFIYMVHGRDIDSIDLTPEVLKILNNDNKSATVRPVTIQPRIDMYIPSENRDSIVVGWLASQLDVMSEDWFIK